MADHDTTDDEAVAVPGGLTNTEVAAKVKRYVWELVQPSCCIGISAFVLFALRYRKRVTIWFDLEETDLLAAHAPWATTYITEAPPVCVISCRVVQGESEGCLSLHGLDLHLMNHWVAGYPDASIPDVGILGEGDAPNSEDKEIEFFAAYAARNCLLYTSDAATIYSV